MTVPRNNDNNTRIRRAMNTLREQNLENLPIGFVERCPRYALVAGETQNSSARRLVRNASILSDPELATSKNVLARIPEGDTRTRVATAEYVEGITTPAGEVQTTLCPEPLSTFMKWTFPPSVGACPCLDGLTINMDWDSIEQAWFGSAPGCTGTIYCAMYDSGVSGAFVGISGTGFLVALTSAELVSHVCGTFNATGLITSDGDTVCGAIPPNSIPVDISER